MRLILALIAALLTCPALAGTLYIDTNGSANFSGSSDSNSAKAGTGAGTATITCSATTYTGSLPGCSFSGSPDLSAVISTPGSTQDSVYISCVTGVSNQLIFWVVAVDDANDKLQVGTTNNSAATLAGCTAATATWNIGGRHVLTSARIEGALRAGDTAIFNNAPATCSAAPCWTFRNAGDSTSGFAKIMGKAGTRPILTESGSGNNVVAMNQNLLWVENLELQQTHATTGVAVNGSGSGNVLYNVKITDSPGNAVAAGAGGWRIVNSEIGGAGGIGGVGITSANVITVMGSYIHDITGDCIDNTSTAPTSFYLNNIIDTCGGIGIAITGGAGVSAGGAAPVVIANNTIYGGGADGVKVTDVDTSVILENNIFSDNGNAGTEANVEFVSPGTGDISGFHGYNTFWCTGLSGNTCTSTALNTIGLTINSLELSSNPLMSAPASGNFTLGSTSPALGAGFPGQTLGATGLAYMAIGAQQAQASAGGGGISFIGAN